MRLTNPIYIGTLRWGEDRTGIISDTRVVEPNPDGPELIPNYCPPLVTVDVFQAYSTFARRAARSLRSLAPRKRRTDEATK